MTSAFGRPAEPGPALLGRDAELAVLHGRVAAIGGARGGGGGVVVVGEPGIGKSALLDAVAARSSSDGVDVLAVKGLHVESRLAFAGLHHLLRDRLDDLDRLPRARARALGAAFGLADAIAPEPFLVGLAVLDLLTTTAAERPVLVVIDDAHWLDRESSTALAFVARRLTADPVLLVAATRHGSGTALTDTITDRLDLGPVDDVAAAALLESGGRRLSPSSRRQVLRWAAGNPLALLELPQAVTGLPSAHAFPTGVDDVPTTERLRRAFATRTVALPSATRAILLVAAFNDSSDRAETLAAASVLTGSAVLESDARSAVRAGLLRPVSGPLEFRHPLVRAAVREEADPEQRQATHRALATVLAGQRDRRAWHLAAAASMPDDELASELELIATRARRRGGASVALAAQWRAITLTTDRAARTRRVLTGAELAFESGDRSLLERLLGEVDTADLDLVDRARVELLGELFDFRPWTPASLLAVTRRAASVGDAGYPDLAMRLLSSAVARALLGNADDEVLQRICAVADGLGIPVEDPSLLSLLAHADPVGRGAAVRAQVRRALATADATAGPDALFALSRAAGAAGDAHAQFQAGVPAIAGLRAAGRMSVAVQALWNQAAAAWSTGDWPAGTMAAAEAVELGQETSQPLWAAAARLSESAFASVRGDFVRARHLIDATVTERPDFSPHQVERAEGLLALASGRFEAAQAHLGSILTPGHPAFHRVMRGAVVSEYAEAAAACGRRVEARAVVAQVVAEAGPTPSPLLLAGLTLAAALLADDDAERCLAEATAPSAEDWPFLFARAHLARGAWSRRNRKIAASRASLRLARQVFDRLGAVPWSERAQRELRAAGEAVDATATPPTGMLTPQELQVATLASRGLTNRQIGEQLFLSHRTVATYLYQVYPKLGVSTRGQLSAVLNRDERSG